jgi:hypothetical protein
VFERVDFFLQFSFDELCHGLLATGLRQGLTHYTLGLRVAAHNGHVDFGAAGSTYK